MNDVTGEEISWIQKTITAAVSHEGKVRQVLYISTDAHLLVSGKGHYGDGIVHARSGKVSLDGNLVSRPWCLDQKSQ